MDAKDDGTQDEKCQSRKEHLFRRMDKRWEERSQQQSANQNLRRETTDNYKFLTTQITDWTSSIQSKIKEASEKPLDPQADFMKNTDVLDSIAKEMQKFDSYFKENNDALSNFDVRKTQLAVNDIRSDYLKLQDLLQPKKKFGFRSKPKLQSQQPKAETRKVAPATVPKEDYGYNITNAEGKPVVDVPESDVRDRDASMDMLTNCVVKILGTPSTVHATNLDKVVLICGPVKTSIFLENCTNCTFVLACQQLRVHATLDSKFYLHVTSKGIIEDCKGVGFAPYNLTYPSLKEHFAQSGLDESRNAWDKIDDFNWLSSDKPSPNWHLLPDGERKPDWSRYLK